MEEGSKRRLVGAAVVVVLLVIFVPMVLEEDTRAPVPDGALDIPPRPDLEQSFAPSLTEPPEEPATRPMPPELSPPALYAEDSAMEVDTLESESQPAPQPPDLAPDAAPETAARSAPVTQSPPPPARAPAPGNLSSWVVQVAALTELARARELEKDLRDKGFPAFVEQAEVKGKTYYRVRVGPEADRERIKTLAASLKQKAGHEGQITRYP